MAHFFSVTHCNAATALSHTGACKRWRRWCINKQRWQNGKWPTVLCNGATRPNCHCWIAGHLAVSRRQQRRCTAGELFFCLLFYFLVNFFFFSSFSRSFGVLMRDLHKLKKKARKLMTNFSCYRATGMFPSFLTAHLFLRLSNLFTWQFLLPVFFGIWTHFYTIMASHKISESMNWFFNFAWGSLKSFWIVFY